MGFQHFWGDSYLWKKWICCIPTHKHLSAFVNLHVFLDIVLSVYQPMLNDSG